MIVDFRRIARLGEKNFIVIAFMTAFVVLCTGCVLMPQSQESIQLSDNMTMEVTSGAFRDGEMIPVKHTGDGDDASPPLAWSGAPANVGGYALICDDPDAPMGTFTHWVIYGIPGDATGLSEGVPQVKVLDNGAMQGKNGFGKIGYGGPAPPAGSPHRYRFHVYALDAKPDLPAGISKGDLLKAIKGHVIAEGELTGIYKR